MANVAQLVEPRIVVPVVAGSIPVVRPKGLSEDSPFFLGTLLFVNVISPNSLGKIEGCFYPQE